MFKFLYLQEFEHPFLHQYFAENERIAKTLSNLLQIDKKLDKVECNFLFHYFFCHYLCKRFEAQRVPFK